MTANQRVTRLVLLGVLVLPLTALAKRIPAPVVEPVVHEGLRYTVPNDKGTVGYVVAWDVATGMQLWKKTIFRKCICPFLEHDVQWVFIKQMRLDGQRLVVVNERDKTYGLDLKTRRVKKMKQQSQAQRGPNKPDPANPAIASLFHAGHQWRGVADPGRWAALTLRMHSVIKKDT